jgi:hypothetical protein
MSIFSTLLGWLLKGPLDRIFKTIDNSIDNETERQRIKEQALGRITSAQVAVLTGPGWWFPLFFIIPLGTWFTSVCFYSILFCQNCVYPVSWTIAALPKPLDEWSGIIISSLFIGGIGGKLVSSWRS